jgi:hypothetical protein
VAEVRYVVVDYSDEDYLEVGSTVGYFEFEYVQAGYVASVVSGTADLTAAFSHSATGIRAKISAADITSTAAITSTVVKCRIGIFSETNTFSLTATALQLVAAELTAFNTISLTASAVKIFGAETTINSNSTLAATALKIQPGAAQFSAFNTVVSAAGRIRPAADISGMTATLTASAGKIFGASTNTFDAYSASQFPITGVHLTEDSYANGIGQLLYRDSTSYNQSQFFNASTVIAFYTKLDAQSEGVIFSFSGDGLNRPPWAFTFNPANANNSFRVGTPYGRTWTSLPDVTNIHHYAIHFGGANGVTLYVDGIIQNSYSGSISAPGVGWYENYPVLYLGRSRTIENFGYPGGPNDYQEVQGGWIEADLAQLWIGRPAGSGLDAPQFVRITGYRFDTFESFGIYGNLSDNQVTTVGNNPASGAGTDSTLSQPNFYAEFNDWTPAGTLNQIYFASYPLQGNFAVVAAAFAITFGEASIGSTTSLSASAGYLKPASISMSSEFGFTATPYGFTKAEVSMQTAFAFTADADEISSGVNLTLAAVSLTAVGTVIRSGVVVTTLFADIAVTATTNQLASADITAQASLTVITYEFTKASAGLTAQANLAAEARLQARTRGNVEMQTAFNLSATSLRFRDGLVPMTSAWTFANGVTRAIKGGAVSMSAFDTVLSAGKIIEFLAENTIVVTEEQRRLKVALESTVLLVQMANGVNTITAETTDIVVPQEQGRLLAQFNMPTN